jgi:dihydropteroate synthase
MKKTIKIKGNIMDLSIPKIMGIINLTSDSFFSGSRVDGDAEILRKIEQMIEDGVDIVDLGAYSTRPGATEISEIDESEKISNALTLIRKKYPNLVVSIDTFRSKVAETALNLDADIINDVSGGGLDKNMFSIIAKYNVPYILMHMRGNPQNMAKKNQYNNLVTDVMSELKFKINELRDKGVGDVIIDPGFGFSKDLDQNYQLLSFLEIFKLLDLPLLVGVSRKSMIYKFLEIRAEESLNASTALHMFSLCNGANILRVHDVKEAVQTVKLFDKILKSKISLP